MARRRGGEPRQEGATRVRLVGDDRSLGEQRSDGASAIDSAPRAPSGRLGRIVSVTAMSAPASTASASAASASMTSSAPPASTVTSQPSGTRLLGLPGYAKNETGDGAPTRMRWRSPSSCPAAISPKYARRWIAGMPAPRSMRAAKVSARSWAPVAAAMRAAARSPGSRSAAPPSRSADGSRDRSSAATLAIVETGTAASGLVRTGAATTPPSTTRRPREG